MAADRTAALRSRQADAYQEQLGEAARARQEQAARDYHVCCGEHRDGGHHEACPNRPAEPEPPRVHPDQAALL